MKHHLLFAASLAVISLAGCNREADSAANATPDAAAPDMPAQSAAGQSENPGQSFANVAAANDAFAIESSKLAVEKAGAARIKIFAEQMVKAHTESVERLRAASAAASPAITPVTRLSAAQQAQLDDLNGKSGVDFDRAYVDAQIFAHQSALDSLKGYSAGGDVPSLKDFATGLLPIMARHLAMARALRQG